MTDDEPATLDHAIRNILSQEHAGPGNVQIMCLPIGRSSERVGTFFAHLLFLYCDGKRVFEKLRLIVPPGTDPAAAARDIAEAADATLVRAGNDANAEGRVERLQSRIEVVVAENLSADTLLHIAREGQSDHAVAIIRAAQYRVPGLVNATLPGTTSILGSDETWAPHLQEIARLLAECAEDTDRFFLLDTGNFKPSPALLDALHAIPHCSILTASLDDPEAEVDARMPEWRRWIADGQIGRVLQDLDAIDGFEEEGKRIVRIQLLDAAGLKPQALAMLREMDPTAPLPPSIAAKLARIAAEARAGELALALLRPVAPNLSGQEELQNGLRAADRAGDDTLSAIMEKALATRFPESNELRNYRYRAAVSAGDHASAADLLTGAIDSEDAIAFHRKLADAFAVTGVPDYDALVDSCGKDEEEAAKYLAASAADALRRGAIVHAFELSMDPRLASRDAGSGTLLGTVEQLLIYRPSGTIAIELERIIEAIDVLCRRLSSQPGNAGMRSMLIDLLEPGVAGDYGLPIALQLLLQAASRPLNPTLATPIPSSPGLDELIRGTEFMDAIQRWMEREAPIQIGRATFPIEDLPGTPDEVAASILSYLGDGAESGAMVDDRETLNIILAVGTSIAPHAADADIDLKMIRTAGIGLAVGGSRQPARDLAELLIVRPDTPRRRRLAWFGLADIYIRCGDKLLGALYAVLGLRADGEVDDDQLWHETLIINRILRDSGLTDAAISVLDSAEQLLARMGRLDDYGHRVDTMRMFNRLTRLPESDDPAGFVSDMLVDAVENARTVLDRGDMVAPVAALLTQLNRFARELSLAPDPDALRIEAELREKLDGGLARHVEIYGRDVPTQSDLLELLAAPQEARYSDDVGKDAHAATMTARRALDADETIADSETACLAIEICCDRAIAAPGWEIAKVPPAAPTSAAALTSAAADLSTHGLRVVHAAFSRDESLVSLIAEDGVLRVEREAEANMALSRLRTWKERYPFAYGVDEDDANRFYTSTESLLIEGIAGGATLIVGDKHLRSLPPNLLRIGDSFAGELQAMAAAPSLSWLEAARARDSLGDGRRLAWISGAETSGTTLATLGDWMSSTLDQHGVALDRGQAVPANFAGASVAIVAAHGGLNPGGTSFQVVTDEGRLAVAGSDFAAALHIVGVVILFVCSGGRSDAHPAADATVGLARDLLDQGAQAVIASPWPMDSIVAPPWIEAFLSRWDSGDTLIEAVFAANSAMLLRWPHDYAKGLAMNLLGNPLLRA